MYAALREISSIEKNIVTVEDPIEYQFPLIRQTQVNEKAGYIFSSAVRAFLRQDPDVILIGEIRDGDTATMALRAAQTGHLVLSTVHANDASGAIPRLKDLGMKDYMISSSLICVIAQRLVRALCPHCKQAYDSGEDEHRVFGIQKGTTLYAPVGCPRCIKTGYLGRIMVAEILVVFKEDRAPHLSWVTPLRDQGKGRPGRPGYLKRRRYPQDLKRQDELRRGLEGAAVMIYSYNALKKDGTILSSKGNFESIRELMDALSSQELILVSYREQKYQIFETIKTLTQPSVKRMEIAEFCESLASMIGSGLPLLDSMESIKDTIRVKRLREAIEEVVKEIAQGESLSGAFSHQPAVFPEMLMFFCNIGEETGTIQTALSNTADYLKRVDGIVSQVKRALIYPCFVVCAMLGVIIFWLFFVLPRLVATFKEINVQLPNITVSLVNFVKFSKQNWFIYPIATVGLILPCLSFSEGFQRYAFC